MKHNWSLKLLALPAALATILPTAALAGGAANGNLLNGAVYTQLDSLNAPNKVIAYFRSDTGSLSAAGEYDTGGMGDNEGVIPSGQNPVLLDDSDPAAQYLFVVNPGKGLAGSDGSDPNGTVSVFRVETDRLVLTDTVSANGIGTRSVAKHGNRVFVVNGGTGKFQFGDGPGAPDPVAAGQPLVANPVSANISGYTFDATAGTLTPITGSVKNTNNPFGDPAQISFSNDGNTLIVSQRTTTFALQTGLEPDNVETFKVNGDGSVADPVVSPVTGNDTFGFVVDKNSSHVIFTHGNAQHAAGGGMSVMNLNADGTMSVVIPNLPDGQSDTCWNVISYRSTPPRIISHAAFDSGLASFGLMADGTLDDGGLRITGANPDGSPILAIIPKIRTTGAPRAAGHESDPPQFLLDNGGFDLALTSNGTAQFVYAVHNPVQIPVSHVVNHGTNVRLLDPDKSGPATPVLKGRIALEIEAAEMWFRKVEIKMLEEGAK